MPSDVAAEARCLKTDMRTLIGTKREVDAKPCRAEYCSLKVLGLAMCNDLDLERKYCRSSGHGLYRLRMSTRRVTDSSGIARNDVDASECFVYVSVPRDEPTAPRWWI